MICFLERDFKESSLIQVNLNRRPPIANWSRSCAPRFRIWPRATPSPATPWAACTPPHPSGEWS